MKPESEMGSGIAGRVNSYRPLDFPDLMQVSGDSSNPCSDSITIAFLANRFEHDPVIRIRPIIAKQERRIIHVRDDHIDVSIIVEICKRRSPSRLSSLNSRSSLRRNIQKRSILLVEEQSAWLSIALLKMAVFQKRIDMSVGVINVFPSIIIEVSKASTPAHQE